MLKLFSVLLFLSFFSDSFAQERDLLKIADSITNEGKAMFRSEWASWYGTDIFMAQYKDGRALSGGYISYDTGHGLNNVFFSKGDDPKILATISFGYDFNSKNYKLDTSSRKFTSLESELFAIRKTAIKEVNKDTLFKYYKNTNLNFVPLISKNSKKVYIITGPDVAGVVVFGNDYLIDFDQSNNIVSKRKLHKGIIPIQYGKSSPDSNKTVLASMHTHLPQFDEFITATDICTLMLYEKFTTWNQCIVVSKNYFSIWDCKKNLLAILTKEAWQKINGIKGALDNDTH